MTTVWNVLRGAAAAFVILGSAPARGQQSLAISYAFGGPLGPPPTVVGTTLLIEGSAPGSLTTADPALNALWNPVTYNDRFAVDLTTGLGNGTFVFTFATGDRLFGDLFEDVSRVLATGTGATTQRLTFRGGTGQFAGASGVATGTGEVTATGFADAGSGTLTFTPEPTSVALFGGGLVTLWGLRRRRRQG